MKDRKSTLGPRNVLIVSHDSDTRRYASEQLRTAGYGVFLASTAVSAGDELAAGTFSFVIADLSAMSGSGLLFIDDVRNQYYGVKLIAVSANPRLRALAKDMGIKAVLDKPLQGSHLMKALGSAAQRNARVQT